MGGKRWRGGENFETSSSFFPLSKISSWPNFHFQDTAVKTILDHKKLPEVSLSPLTSLGQNCFTTLVNLTNDQLCSTQVSLILLSLTFITSSAAWSFLIHVTSAI